MASYVLAEATDGYRVVFSLAELDSGVVESEVIVADTMDGAALGAQEGPFRLVAPHEKRPALGEDAQVDHGRARSLESFSPSPDFPRSEPKL
jgi:hypothetical protein